MEFVWMTKLIPIQSIGLIPNSSKNALSLLRRIFLGVPENGNYLLIPLAHRISTLLDFAEYLVFICDFSQADFFAAFEKILSRAQNRGLC